MKNEIIGIEIKTINNLIIRHITKELKKNNKPILSPIQVDILKYIFDSKKDVFQNELESVFKLRRSTISGILKTMEKNGLIKRVSNEEDARVKKIVLTDYAINTREEFKKQSIEFDNMIKKGISDEELKIFFEVIKKIEENLNK